jgi:hypothetical protein
MTVINGIEIDFISYKENEMKRAIQNNEPIEEYLHVIAVISNSGQFARRYILMKEFMERIEREETNVKLYIVELAYGNKPFIITKSKEPQHLQLRVDVPLWHKENLVNIGVQKLLPDSWKAFAWIDADIEFENVNWATDTLCILNGSRDIVQLFSHCLDMNLEEQAMKVFNSFGFQYTKKHHYVGTGVNYWHPGYAWAMTRRAYERVGGLYEHAILGSGDNIMALSMIDHGLSAINKESSEDYKISISDYQSKIRKLRLGYVPGVIRHHFHGAKKNRRYEDRWRILLDNGYVPKIHVSHDSNGVLIPTKECPLVMLEEIRKYFEERNEDEGIPKIA